MNSIEKNKKKGSDIVTSAECTSSKHEPKKTTSEKKQEINVNTSSLAPTVVNEPAKVDPEDLCIISGIVEMLKVPYYMWTEDMKQNYEKGMTRLYDDVL